MVEEKGWLPSLGYASLGTAKLICGGQYALLHRQALAAV